MKLNKKAAQYMVKFSAVGYIGSAILGIGYPLYKANLARMERPAQISLAKKLDSDFRKISAKDVLDEKVLQEYREKAKQYMELTDDPEYKKIKSDWEYKDEQVWKGILYSTLLSLGGTIISGASHLTGKIRLDKLEEEDMN